MVRIGVVYQLLVAAFVWVITSTNLLMTWRGVTTDGSDGADSSVVSNSSPLEEGAVSLFATSRSTWDASKVPRYQNLWTPRDDPKKTRHLLYTARNKKQTLAEIENSQVLVKYITNSHSLQQTRRQNHLLIRVLVLRGDQALAECQQRWNSILQQSTIPFPLDQEDRLKIQVEYIRRDKIDSLFQAPPAGTAGVADWILIVKDTTYVNLQRLVVRLFADIDPSKGGAYGGAYGLVRPFNITSRLMQELKGIPRQHWPDTTRDFIIQLPYEDAGILFTGTTLQNIYTTYTLRRGKAPTNAAPNLIEEWIICYAILVQTTAGKSANSKQIQWTPLAGLNPYNPRQIIKFSMEGNLYVSSDEVQQQGGTKTMAMQIQKTYQSVGGTIRGTATLPITYGKMITTTSKEKKNDDDDDDLFYQQLQVDTAAAATTATTTTTTKQEKEASSSGGVKIPKIIHQIWSGPISSIRPEVQLEATKCQQMHESLGWKYMFWNDTTIDALVEAGELPKIPKMSTTKWLKRMYTDVLRLYILHKYGGVYLDIDSICLRPFDPLLQYMESEKKNFLVNYESERLRGRQIANGIIISAPASPVLVANALHIGIKISDNPKWYTELDYQLTGPWATTEIRDQWESWVQPNTIVLSSSAFIPLYKDEGDGLELQDIYELAKRQGSYTIQMYQKTKQRSMFKKISTSNAFLDNNNNQTSSGKSVYSYLRKGSTTKAAKAAKASTTPSQPQQQSNILMIVAHPDDEVLWGGDFLLQEANLKKNQIHVVVTATESEKTNTRRKEFLQSEITNTRRKEFYSIQDRLGMQGWEFLDGMDTLETTTASDGGGGLEDHIRKHIHDLICGSGGNNNNDDTSTSASTSWDQIITHGPEGEYGHPQHQQLHDAVLAKVQECIGSFDKLFVFNPTLVEGTRKQKQQHAVFSNEKSALAKLYQSQEKVIFKTFGNWAEKIVPLGQYDFRSASDSCEKSAAAVVNVKKRNARHCRLRQMIQNMDSTPILSTEKWSELVAARESWRLGVVDGR